MSARAFLAAVGIAGAGLVRASFIIALAAFAGSARAQLSVTTTGTVYTIDFDTTVSGVNNGAYAGPTTFAKPTPAAGELNSNAWAVTGQYQATSTSLSFGGTITAQNYWGRGLTTSPSGVGFFAYNGANRQWAINPGRNSTDSTMQGPGLSGGVAQPNATITLRIKNNTGQTITSWTLAYDLFANNLSANTNGLAFSYSTDNVTYSTTGLTDPLFTYASPTTSDGLGFHNIGRPSATVTPGTGVANGGYFYVRWTVSGNVSGANDWPGLDNIAVTANAGTVYTTIAALQYALNGARPGDIFILANNTYTDAQITIPSGVNGTSSAHITLQAQAPGGVTFTGNSTQMWFYSSYTDISGFRFDGINKYPSTNPLVRFTGAANSRLTDCAFRNCGNTKDKKLFLAEKASNYARVDHCYFSHPSTTGLCQSVGIGGNYNTPSSDWSTNVQIDHNWFYNIGVLKDGAESIQLGSGGTGISGTVPVLYALVEWNLLENAQGDQEAISIKTSNNTIRYNALLNNTSYGCITNRGGQYNRIEGNFIINCSLGLRIFDANNTIINNYVTAPTYCMILYAGGTNPDPTIDNEAATYNLIANNTLVRTGTGGPNNQLLYLNSANFTTDTVLATNNTIENNVFWCAGGLDTLFGDGGAGSINQNTWTTNIGWNGTNPYTGLLPSSGVTIANPLELLVTDPNGYQLYRPQTGSPALSAGTAVTQVTQDMDGQPRTSPTDIGADEVTTTGTVFHYPVPRIEVGPGFLAGIPW